MGFSAVFIGFIAFFDRNLEISLARRSGPGPDTVYGPGSELGGTGASRNF